MKKLLKLIMGLALTLVYGTSQLQMPTVFNANELQPFLQHDDIEDLPEEELPTPEEPVEELPVEELPVEEKPSPTPPVETPTVEEDVTSAYAYDTYEVEQDVLPNTGEHTMELLLFSSGLVISSCITLYFYKFKKNKVKGV